MGKCIKEFRILDLLFFYFIFYYSNLYVDVNIVYVFLIEWVYIYI